MPATWWRPWSPASPQRVSTIYHLANIAFRTGRKLKFDPETEQIVGDDEANRMLSRTYRKEGHWAVSRVSPG